MLFFLTLYLKNHEQQQQQQQQQKWICIMASEIILSTVTIFNIDNNNK